MARSHAIWLLIDRENTASPVEPVAAFTVKHELKTWLNRNRWQWDQLRLFRMLDGPHPNLTYRDSELVEELDIREVMK